MLKLGSRIVQLYGVNYLVRDRLHWRGNTPS